MFYAGFDLVLRHKYPHIAYCIAYLQTLHRTLVGMLEYEEEDFEEVYCQTFEITYRDVFGHLHSHRLKANGDAVAVTRENRQVGFFFTLVKFSGFGNIMVINSGFIKLAISTAIGSTQRRCGCGHKGKSTCLH